MGARFGSGAHSTAGRALFSKARLITLVNFPLGGAVSLLLWRSLDWPLIGDATIFYFIHLAVVAIGGMSDVAWRAFDLASAAVMSGLILMLVWRAGRALAIHAA